MANVRDFSITVDNVLNVERYNLGVAGIKSEQLINNFRKITGKATVEFTDTAFLTKYVNDTTTALALTFTGPNSSSLSITVSAVKFDGDTPKVAGPGVIDLALTFEGYDNGTDAPLTIVYTPEA